MSCSLFVFLSKPPLLRGGGICRKANDGEVQLRATNGRPYIRKYTTQRLIHTTVGRDDLGAPFDGLLLISHPATFRYIAIY